MRVIPIYHHAMLPGRAGVVGSCNKSRPQERGETIGGVGGTTRAGGEGVQSLDASEGSYPKGGLSLGLKFEAGAPHVKQLSISRSSFATHSDTSFAG